MLLYMFGQTSNYDEVRFIVNKLKYLGIKITHIIYEHELYFVEDYDNAQKLRNNIKKCKVANKRKTPIKSNIYDCVLDTTNTLDEVEKIFLDMKKNNIPPTITSYMVLMEKQKNYINARKIFNQFILSSESQRERVNRWKTSGFNDPMRETYGIMYIKAENYNEQQEIINELKSVKMSLNINDYKYLRINRCSRRINDLKESLSLDKSYEREITSFLLGGGETT